jgi:MFS family permease
MRSLFGNRDFARLFAGRLVTNVGDSLYFVAAMWLVYDLTGNATYSGIAGFLVLGPSALQAFAGPLVDRWNIRRLLVATQLIQCVVIAALPVAAHFGYLSVWLVLTVMPLLALLNQLVYPAQSAALPRIVEDDELVDANSLFTLAYQGTDTVANALGGVLVAVVGAVALFTVDAVTFAVAATLFAFVTIPPAETDDDEDPAPADGSAADNGGAAMATDGGDETDEGELGDDTAEETADGDADTGYLADLREGIGYVRGTVLVPIIAGATVVNFAAGGTVMAAMPAFADTLGGSGAYGALMAAISVGSLLGALVSSRLDHRPFGLLSALAFVLSGVLWFAGLAASTTGSLAATAVLFTAAFVPVGVSNVLLSAVVQSIVPERLVGRVSSVLGSAASAAMPVGALVGGTLTELVGPLWLFGCAGVAILGLGVYWLSDARLRGLAPVGDIETLST